MTLGERAICLWTGGTAKPSPSGEVTVECPSCGYTNERGEGKLAFNVLKGIGQCFACGKGFTTLSFIKAAGLEERITPRPYASGELSLVGERPPESGHKPARQGEEVGSLGLVPLLEDSSVMAERALSYLMKRGVTLDMVRRYRVGLSSQKHLLGRVVFPVYRQEQLVYYQARAIGEGLLPKYLNPAAGDRCEGKASVVAYLEGVRKGRPLVLCEGLMSAWGASLLFSCPAVAILGKSLSESQLVQIVQSDPSEVTVALDSDASFQERIQIVAALNSWGIPAEAEEFHEGDPWDAWMRSME